MPLHVNWVSQGHIAGLLVVEFDTKEGILWKFGKKNIG